MRTPRKPRTTTTGDLTTAQAAAVLGVDQDTVRSQAVRLGGRMVLGRWRYPAATVHEAAQGRRPAPPPTNQEPS